MCDLADAPIFAASLSKIILDFSSFQFFCFFCYAVHRIIRRLLR